MSPLPIPVTVISSIEELVNDHHLQNIAADIYAHHGVEVSYDLLRPYLIAYSENNFTTANMLWVQMTGIPVSDETRGYQLATLIRIRQRL